MKFSEFKKELRDVEEFAQGWRGRIYTADWKGMKVSVKVAKNEHVVKAIQKEAELLELLKGAEGFPQLLLRGEDFFVYRFIEGTPLGKLKLSREEEKRVLRRLLEVAYRLDEMGINKDEFSHVEKNVLLDKEGRVYVLDFERGKLSDRPANLTQFLQLLLRKGYMTLEEAISLGRRYREDRERVFREVLSKLE
ncbi:hypothetical protein [Hydrogenivirga sp.]